MANQIGKFFRAQGDERAVNGICDHLKKFWEPRMKAGIFKQMDAGGEGLDPLVLTALKKLREMANADGTMKASAPTVPPVPAADGANTAPVSNPAKGVKGAKMSGRTGKAVS
ncbi:formate dehydrogenase subunit delta [Hyphomicrobium sp.]|uniref:formate dehydrogenase subunit delta n=1 Tax=Hyphomicrobium sp. TaxID=82 RepID=UPI003F6FE891